MENNTTLPWIEAGYELMSKSGPGGLKVEVLSSIVKKSKSSFYHHFAATEIFISELLSYHLTRAKLVAEKLQYCTKLNPDILHLFLEHKTDLLFVRQLRVHRDKKEFRECFQKSEDLFESAFIGFWSNAIGLEHRPNLAKSVLTLTIDNFYLQITEETLTYEWLSDYVEEIEKMVANIRRDAAGD